MVNEKSLKQNYGIPLYNGAPSMKRKSCFAIALYVATLTLLSCSSKGISSKADILKLSESGDYEQIYNWTIEELSSSPPNKVLNDSQLLETAVGCLISHYNMFDTSLATSKSTKQWLSRIESYQYSRPNMLRTGFLSEVYLKNNFHFVNFTELVKHYLLASNIMLPNFVDSMFYSYHGSQFMDVYEKYERSLAGKDIAVNEKSALLMTLLNNINPYIQHSEESYYVGWLKAITKSLELELLEAQQLEVEIRNKKLEIEKLQKHYDTENIKLSTIHDAERKIWSLKEEVKKRKATFGSTILLSGNIIKLVSQTSYNKIYECRSYSGNSFLLETSYTEFNSQGRFSLYANEQGTEVITTVDGFQQTWMKYGEIDEASYRENMKDFEILEEEIINAEKKIALQKSKFPTNIDKILATVATQIATKRDEVTRLEGQLASFPQRNNVIEVITDIDGNKYKVIELGDQKWLAENLKVTHYRDGSEIPQLTSNDDWVRTPLNAFCYYDNQSMNGVSYGMLYNWYVVSDSRNIAPVGWHIASHAEWNELKEYLEMNKYGQHARSPAFAKMFGGNRAYYNGKFSGLNQYGYYWSSTQSTLDKAWYSFWDKSTSDIKIGECSKTFGYSIRCVKD